MHIIRHRVNTIEELRLVPKDFGVEVDIRSWGGELIVEHDAFTKGVSVQNWLKEYAHGLLIANVKEDGLEDRLTELFTAAAISNFIFLDLPMPTLLRKAKQGLSRAAARVSKYESVENAIKLAEFCEWAWVDHLDGYLPSQKELLQLKNVGFKICLVSPELVFGVNHDISPFTAALNERRFIPDAVCSKFPERWAEWWKSVLSSTDKPGARTDHRTISTP
jgi:hypothetical protein